MQDIFSRAVAAQRAARTEEAERLCHEILVAEPGNFDARLLLGALCRLRGDNEGALASYDRALAARPDSADAHFNRANTLRSLNRLEDALTSYERALEIRPGDAEVLNNRGVVLNELGRAELALTSFARALALRPEYVEAVNNRGNALQALGRHEEALLSYERALALRPGYAEAFNNHGNALQALGQHERALASYARALELRPEYADARGNRARALRALGDREQALDRQAEAAAYFEASIADDARDAEVHWNLALALLALGDYERGWREYEWRWLNPAHNSTKRDTDKPRWLGGDPLAEKTILLHPEQGFGDAIQAVRYVPLLASRGARVLLMCQRPLRSLFEDVEGAAAVIGASEPLPDFDCHIPIMSLPLAFGTTLDTIPARVPYLAARPAQVERWRARLAEGRARLNVGIAWSGNPEFPRAANKACPPERLARVLGQPGCRFFSLQKGAAAFGIMRLDPGGAQVADVAGELDTFADTAALVSALDLVITVDTAVAHLAGALGKRVWIMLPFNADWRWLRGRADSPWYPTARLFRQPVEGDWASVVDEVAVQLGRISRHPEKGVGP